MKPLDRSNSTEHTQDPPRPASDSADDRIDDPTAYHEWYATPRGVWIADREFGLMLALLRPIIRLRGRENKSVLCFQPRGSGTPDVARRPTRSPAGTSPSPQPAAGRMGRVPTHRWYRCETVGATCSGAPPAGKFLCNIASTSSRRITSNTGPRHR